MSRTMGVLANPDLRPAALPQGGPGAEPLAALCHVWAGRALPWCVALAALALAGGLALGLVVAPQDLLQGDAYRIVFVHVPAAAMSVALYVALAVCALAVLAGAQHLPALLARAIAPTGALMSFLALWTGSLWARPLRGLWWDWDARFVAEMMLLVLFVAVIALHAGLEAPRRADRAAATLALGGVLPLASLPWWVHALPVGEGLHAGATPPPPADAPVRWGLMLMAAAFLGWTLAAVLHRWRTILVEREREAAWVREVAKAGR